MQLRTEFVQKVHSALLCNGHTRLALMRTEEKTAIQNINKKMHTASEGTHCMRSAAIETVQRDTTILLYEYCKRRVCMKLERKGGI